MEKTVEEYIRELRRNDIEIKDIPIDILMEHPEIIIIAIKYVTNPGIMKDIPNEIVLKNPNIYLDIVKENKFMFEYLPKEVMLKNPEFCIDIVKENNYTLQYLPKEVMLKNPELCMDIVKKETFMFKFLPKEIMTNNPSFCMNVVKENKRLFEYLPKEVMLKNPEFYVDLVKENNYMFQYLPKEVMLKNPEFCMDIVKKESFMFRFLPKEIMVNNPDFCIELAMKYSFCIGNTPKEIIIANLDMYLDIVKNNLEGFGDLPEEVKLIKPDFCLDIVEKCEFMFEYLPKEIMLNNPEFCIKIVKRDKDMFKYLPKEIMVNNPEFCINIVKDDKNMFEYLPEEIMVNNPDFCIDIIKEDEYKYRDIPEKVLKNTKEIDKYMFGGDLERFYALRERGNYNLSVEENSLGNMNVFYHKMIKTIGIDEVEKIIEVPSLTKEEIERYQLQYNEKFNELFDKKYTLTGDTEALVKIFRGIDLRGYKTKGKNARFEVFKNINKILDEEKDINLDELVSRAINDSGFEVDSKVIEKLNSNKKAIINTLADQRFDKVRNELMERLNEGLTSQQAVVSRIIESKIKASLADNDGRINVDDVLLKIEEELNRTRENGGSFYSPHVLHQREQIKNIATEFLKDRNIEKNLSKSLVTIMKEKKSEIGKGWIRKIQGVSLNLSKEEYEKLEEKLGIKLDATYSSMLKDGVDEKEAYKLLAETQVPGIVTFNQIETMFSGMKEPYSEEFKNFYKKNREEILSKPEIYTKLSQMHNEFDSIINKASVINRYNAGEVTVDDYIRILSERKYVDIRDGNERFANKASEAGISQDEFNEAQRVFEITRKREGTSIPQVNVKGKKFRGRMLRADDAINLFAGNFTTCCQRFGDVGEGAMLHGSTEKNGGIFVVEELDEKGKVEKVVGQSWTWRNKDRVCFDNIEISDVEHKNLTEEDEKEIMEIYMTAGKNAIETDQKVMDKLLKVGKINQQVYDAVVLKEVTVGLNQYNDLGELEKRIKDGTLKDVKEIVLPKEADKIYIGVNNYTPWIDSSQRQILLAKMDDKKREEIEKRVHKESRRIEYEEPVVYKNVREVEELVGDDIVTIDIEKIKKIEKVVYREGQQVLQDCENVVDVASKYDMDEDKIEITMSKDGDWYMIGEEYDNEYYIADLAMVGGVNSQSNEKIDYNAKIATFEIAEKMYEKMIEMGKKEKNIRYEATRDTSYVNTLRMTEKGLGEIIQNEEDRFEDTDIKMNNVVLKPNVEKLEKELEKIREILAKVRKRELQRTVEPKKEDVDDISI